VLSQEMIDKIFAGGIYDDADGAINLENPYTILKHGGFVIKKSY
jgi:hypothetical protein